MEEMIKNFEHETEDIEDAFIPPCSQQLKKSKETVDEVMSELGNMILEDQATDEGQSLKGQRKLRRRTGRTLA